MQKMKKFMVVHRDPNVSWEKVEENWSKMTSVAAATWVRTYYNVEEKVRFCLWLAPSSEELEKIFSKFKVKWESIVRVDETVPDIWERQYLERMEAEEREDTISDF